MEKLLNYLLSVLFIFYSNQGSLESKTNIILTGDIMLGRSVMTTSFRVGNPSYPFVYVADRLRSADIVFSNLENPIVDGCPESRDGYIFCAAPGMVEGLKFAGIDVLSLANNHTSNYGAEGITETEKILNDNGIKWVGQNNLEIIQKNGTKFGFLGFDYVDYLPRDSDLKLIEDSKEKVDVLIVMPHWGIEYAPEPTENQKKIAKSLINAGADIVSGAHPHWVQTTSFIEGKPVFYSLGNFVFDQPWSEETKKGVAMSLTFQKNEIIGIEELPIYMQSLAQPKWVQ